MGDVEARGSLTIPFTRGIDTKSDSKTSQAPFLEVLENGIMQKISTIQPRPGTYTLPAKNAPGSASGLASYDNELLVFDDQVLRTYSAATQTWVSRGHANSVVTGVQTIVKNSVPQSHCDWAVNQQIALYVWKESTGIYVATQDIGTGAYFLTRTLISTSGTQPRAIAVGSAIFVGYGDGGGNFKMAIFSISSPSTFYTKIIGTTMDAGGVFDWSANQGNNYVAFAYTTASTSAFTVGYIDALGFIGHGTNLPGPPVQITTASPPTLIAIAMCDSANAIAVVTLSGGTPGAMDVNSIQANNLTSSLGNGQFVDPNGFTPTNIVLFYDQNGGSATCFYDVANYLGAAGSQAIPNNLYGGYVEKFTFGPGGGLGISAGTRLAANQALASKPFTYGGGVFVAVVYPSYLQATYFVIDDSGNIISSHLFGQATSPGGFVLGQVLPTATGMYAWPVLRLSSTQSVNGFLFSINGVALPSINFVSKGRYLTGRMGEQIHIAGGILQSYDSAKLTEHGFLLAPDRVYTATNTSTGGHITNGTRLYYVVFRSTDKRGQIHRSAVSIPLSVTTSASTSTQKTTLSVLPLVLTVKDDVLIEIYRTTNNGTVAFNITNGALLNVTTSTTLLTFVDTLSDATIQNNEILYTVGGEVDNDPPPACSIIAAGKQRLFIAGGENPYTIYPSKKQAGGQGIGFSLLFAIELGSVTGALTALKVMDDKVIIFTSSSILYFSGDGPDATGANDDFTTPAIVASDVGCIDAASVVLGAEGLYFMSAKGIYLLSRSLQVSYVGAPVEDFNGQTITSALLLPAINQIRFGSSDTAGAALVYNYFFQEPYSDQVQSGQWSTFTKYQSVAACIWQGNYTFVTANGVVHVESASLDTDDLHPIIMRIRTSWITGPVLGFAQIPELAVLGNYLSPHVLLVNLYFDYQRYISKQLKFDTRIGIDLDTWGSADTWGSQSTFGGNGDDSYQFKARIPRQLCEAMQVEFINVVPAGIKPGPCYSLNALAAILEPQEGLHRLPPVKTI